MTMKTIILTQGCRLNQSESASIEQALIQQQFQLTSSASEADIAIINTCTVTQKSDADTRQLIRKLTRQNPHISIALIGCQAQLFHAQFNLFPNVKWIIGTQNKHQIAAIIADNPTPNAIIKHIDPIINQFFKIQTPAMPSDRTRANLKIQDGCDQYCTYCIVPFARGPARSRSFQDILSEATLLSDAQYPEIVLTGVNIGTYQDGDYTLPHVIQALMHQFKRIRLSSIEPHTITPDLLTLFKSASKLSPFLHIPLQHGHNDILQAMNRKTLTAEFKQLLNTIHSIADTICIGTDIIVGFPGETDQHFNQMYTFLQECPIHYIHVFRYSDRPGTVASTFKNKVSPALAAKRAQQIRQLSDEKRRAFFEKMHNRTVPVLFEQKKNGYWWGLTSNFIRVRVSSALDLSKQIREVTLSSFEQSHMNGNLENH